MTTKAAALGTSLTTSLLNEDAFLYAHLVKFERIPNTTNGLMSETASDYSYITDASFNISFDDETKSLAGTDNGQQIYVANRLSKVSNISETTEAKVSNISLTFSSIALNSQYSGSATNRVTISNSSNAGALISLVDTHQQNWTDLGFSEGDKVRIYSSDNNNEKTAVIERFEADNYNAVVRHHNTTTLADGSLSTQTENKTNQTGYNITLDSDEVTGILNDPTSSTYNGYINREVSIYKVHINPETGKVIGMDDSSKKGGPYLLFKGIINKVKLADDPTKSSNITWSLSSHWGDFVRVNGRITSDTEHRAIGGGGLPDIGALFRDDYATDFGFMHGEQAINIIAVYQVQETRYKMKKSGLFGLKTKMKEYQVTVDRDVDLRLNLEAKRLPVIYGVQRTDSIPVFADSLFSDSGKIYVAYAICEGEISGLYDIYVDDQSRICVDKNDSDTRSVQTGEETIDVICEGRMDRGDTLSSAPAVLNSRNRGMARSPVGFDGFLSGHFSSWSNWMDNWWFNENVMASSADLNAASGITHEKQTTLQYPLATRLMFHAGRPHQRANDTLVRIAKNGQADQSTGFKLQTEFDSDSRGAYWSQNHRLLDTAYVVAEYEIAEGDITIPELDFVVRGKEIEQYNYDYSYREHPSPTFSSGTITDKRALFKIGDLVDFYKSSDNSALAEDVQIVDSTTYYNARNEPIHKFRFDKNPFGTVEGVTEFHMTQTSTGTGASDSKYPFITWDYKSRSGTVPAKLFQTITTSVGDGNATVAATTTGGGTGVDFKELTATLQTLLSFFGRGLSIGLILDTQAITDAISTFMQAQANPSTSGGTTQDNDQFATQETLTKISDYGILNAVQLDSAASSTNDFYKGQVITIVNTATDGTQKRQSREIVGYNGATKVAVVGDLTEVATAATATSGSFVVTRGSYNTINQSTLILNNITGLAIGQVISGTTDGLSVIEQGTKITNIVIDASNANYRMITCDKMFRVHVGATLAVNTTSGSNTQEITPGPFDFVPQQGDKFEIAAIGDKKVSINPAIQLTDYLLNARYGRGLDLDNDLNLETFKQAARLCDTRSDISVIMRNDAYTNEAAWNAAVGTDKWKLITTHNSVNYFQWQGTIRSVSKNTDGTVLSSAGTGYVEVTFTDCIGKLVHKWLDWKHYSVGQVVYHRDSDTKNKLHKVTLDTPGKVASSALGQASFLQLTKAGTSTVTKLHVGTQDGSGNTTGATEAESAERYNPVIKKYTGSTSYEKSGYSLYDSDDVKYWRYMGWQDHDQREVTRHQTNSLITTDTPVFDNVNSLLEHFNGILRYTIGKYELDVENTTPSIPAGDVRLINESDIIGAVSLDDAGLKGSSNTVSVSIPDPNIRYETRSVSFFKSDYLKEDRNVPKKKDVKTPLITNYFNARINAEQYLDQSRFSRKINFVLGPKGVLLVAGSIIKLSYERFGWVNKEFRISNLSYRADCSVQVTAQEHNDDTYLVKAKDKDYQSVGSEIAGPSNNVPPVKTPSNLTATGGDNIVELSWINTIGFSNGNDSGWRTEIWYNNNATFSNVTANTDFDGGAVLLHSTKAEEQYKHKVPNITSDTTFYYWVRHVKEVSKVINTKIMKLQSFSDFHPAQNASGVSGTAVATPVTSVADIYLYKAANAVAATEISSDADWPILVVTMDHGANHSTITGVKSGQDSDMAITNGQIIDGSGAATGWFLDTQSVSSSATNLYQVHFHVSTSATTADVAKGDWSTPKVIGSFGTIGTSGVRSSYFTIYHSAASENSPGNPSATKFNFGNSTFTGLTSGWSTTAPQAVAGASTSNYWYATVSAIEGKDGNGTPTGDTTGTGGNLTISSAFIGLAFTGLVTFNSLTDSGNTQIDGSRITSGTISANRLNIGGLSISSLSNDSGYQTQTNIDARIALNSNSFQKAADVNTLIGNNTNGYQTAANVNSLIGDNTNGYQTAGQVNTLIGNNTNGFITSHQSLSGYLTTSVANSTYLSISLAGSTYATAAALTSGLNGKQDAGNYLTNATSNANVTNFNAVANEAGIAFESELVDTLPTSVNGANETKLATFRSALTGAGLTLQSEVFASPGSTTPSDTFVANLGFAGLALSANVADFASNTIITAGTITLRSSSASPSNADNQILISAAANQIVIRDAGVNRVIIGKL